METKEEFQKSSVKLQWLDHRMTSSKMWVDGLLQQIQLMANGSGITNLPLPIDNPCKLPTWQTSIVSMTNCPICTLFDAYNNVVASCGCIYHLFYLGIYLECEMNVCVVPNYGKTLSMDWLSSMGFNQLNMLLKRPKLKKSSPKFTRTSKQYSRGSTSCMFFAPSFFQFQFCFIWT
jgi:hypothetical protein